MNEKKSKALAQELMDDLLNEDVDDIEVDAATNVQPVKVSDALPPSSGVFEFPGTKTHPLPLEDLAADHIEPIDPSSDPSSDATSDATEISDPQGIEPITPARHRAGSGEDRVRASVGRFAPSRSVGPASATEAALAQSESLRVAQARLLEFEQEIERLRLQNEELAAAGETLRRRADELSAANQKRESDYQNLVSTFEQEKEILVNSKEALQRDLAASRLKSEELELRISTNIQKIRVRERELENRLELVKMESAALIRSKDEMILELKRNIDQLNLELNNYRTKNQELNRQTTDKQEQLRRTVKALRLALSMLEGEDEARPAGAAPVAAVPQRKAK